MKKLRAIWAFSIFGNWSKFHITPMLLVSASPSIKHMLKNYCLLIFLFLATQVQSQSEPIPIKCTLNLAGISIPDTVYYSDTITYMIYFILPDRCTNLSSIETEVLGREVKHQLFCTRPNNPCPDVTKEGLIGCLLYTSPSPRDRG